MPIDTGNVYRDTDSRYLHDPEFRAAVKMLEAAAERHGFTPGELRQIAFKAALNIEERRYPRGLTLEELLPGELPVAWKGQPKLAVIGVTNPSEPAVRISTTEEWRERFGPHNPPPRELTEHQAPLFAVPVAEVAGYLKDGTPVFYGRKP